MTNSHRMTKSLVRNILFIFILNIFYIKSMNCQPLQVDWIQQTLDARVTYFQIASDYNIYGVGIDKSIHIEGDILIMKSDSAGNIIWRKNFNGILGEFDAPSNFCLDDSQNVYVAGITDDDNITSNSIILKYDSSGNLIWSANTPGSLSSGWIATDKLFLYVSEFYFDSLAGFFRAGISKYDFNGNLLFRSVDSTNAQITAYRISMDPAGNIYSVGITDEALPGQKSFITKYDSFGNVNWKRVFTDALYIFSDTKILCIDDSSNVYIGGYTARNFSPTGYDCITIKYDSSGNLEWYRVWTVTGNNWETPLAISCNNNRIGLTGRLSLNSPSIDPGNIFVVEYDFQGNFLFSDTINGPYNTADFGNDVIIDSSGNTLLTGYIGGLFGSQCGDLVVYKYDSVGNRELIAKNLCGYGNLLLLDNLGNLFVAGEYGDTINNLFYNLLIKYNNSLNNSIPIVKNLLISSVSPNPTKDYLRVTLKDHHENLVQISIYDLYGKLVRQIENFSIVDEINIDLRELPAGIYVLKNETSKNIFTNVLIKL